jgi:hypothetical protein
LRLSTLEATFVRREVRPCFVGAEGCSTVSAHTEHEFHIEVDTLTEADGVLFLCPKCFAANGGPVGTHGVLCWFEGKVPDDVDSKPGRWNPVGTGLGDLSFVPGKRSHSVLLLGDGCSWHGFVTNGDAT